jgi:rod shape-determining protein MreD
MRRFLVLFASLLLLSALMSQVNHALAGLRTYLFVGALYVTHAALFQSPRTGLVLTLAGGLLCDANAPIAFGTHAVLFAIAHIVISRLRDRIPRDDSISLIIVTLLANLGLFLAFSFTQLHRSPSPGSVWPRLIFDLVCSQVFLTLITPWFLALQSRALVLAGVERQASLG